MSSTTLFRLADLLGLPVAEVEQLPDAELLEWLTFLEVAP